MEALRVGAARGVALQHRAPRSRTFLTPRLRIAGTLRTAASLRERAAVLFPEWPMHMRERWVRARMRLQCSGVTKPIIEIGRERVDISRSARGLRELGGAGLLLEFLPPYLRRLLRITE
jgi:hypothetical protein